MFTLRRWIERALFQNLPLGLHSTAGSLRRRISHLDLHIWLERFGKLPSVPSRSCRMGVPYCWMFQRTKIRSQISFSCRGTSSFVSSSGIRKARGYLKRPRQRPPGLSRSESGSRSNAAGNLRYLAWFVLCRVALFNFVCGFYTCVCVSDPLHFSSSFYLPAKYHL